MRWFLTNPGPASSGPCAPLAGIALCQRTESIRSALIETLQGSQTPGARILLQRLQYAADVERLWYLRPEAMSVLASLYGEARARKALDSVSRLFQDVLPDGLASQLRATGKGHGPAHSRRPEQMKETA